MLGVSVSALDCKQWNPPLSYYLKQKASLKVTHSTKRRVVDQTWTTVEAKRLRRSGKPGSREMTAVFSAAAA